MAKRRLNLERVAGILVEAAYYGDEVTAKEHGITTRTIRNYRSRLAKNDELSAFFRIKKQEFENRWANELPEALEAGIRYLMKAAKQADPSEPKAIHSIANSLKTLADIALTKRVLDARFIGLSESERAKTE